MNAPAGDDSRFDWSAAEEQVADIVEPAFVDSGADEGMPKAKAISMCSRPAASN